MSRPSTEQIAARARKAAASRIALRFVVGTMMVIATVGSLRLHAQAGAVVSQRHDR